MNVKDTPAVAGARRVARHHKQAWGQHAKQCWECGRANGNIHQMCREGAHLAIEFYKARDYVGEVEKAEKGQKGQGELFLWTAERWFSDPTQREM